MLKMLRVFMVMWVALALVACNTNPGTEPQAEAENPSTTQTETEQSSAPAAPALSESYTSDGEQFPEGLSFQYPEGWVVSTPVNNIILVATSEATASKTFTGAAFESGEAVIQLALNTRTDSSEDIAAHVSSFAGSIGIPLGDASAITIGDKPAGRVDGSNDGRHLMAVSVLFEGATDVATGSGDNYVEALAYTNPGEFNTMEPTLLAIIESIDFGSN